MGQLLKISIHAVSRAGVNSEINKDNIYLNGKYIMEEERALPFACSEEYENNIQVFAVCDGMGKEQYGAVPPLAVTQLLKLLQDRLNEEKSKGKERQIIEEFIKDTNNKILLYKQSVEKEDVGTTFAAIFIFGNQAFSVHIGDSRAYLYNKNGLRQLTQDHTEAKSLVELGILKEEQADIHRAKSKVTRYFGLDEEEKPVRACFSEAFTIESGDIIILSTDGITDQIENNEIEECLKENKNDEIIITNNILNKVKKKDETDDVSLIVVKVTDTAEKGFLSKENDGLSILKMSDIKKLMPVMIGVIIVTIIMLSLMAILNRQSIDKKNVAKQINQNKQTQVTTVTPSAVRDDSNDIEKELAQDNTEMNKEKQDNEQTDKIIQTDNQQKVDETNNIDKNKKDIPKEYIVKKGENLYRIAMKFYGTKKVVEKIMMLNDIEDRNKVIAGQVLKLPQIVYDSDTQTSNIPVEYKVKHGDTIYGISMRFYGTNKMINKIMELNGIKNANDDLISGKTIKLP